MTSSKYNEAFKIVIGHEGGYQNMINDRGNWTRGIIGLGIRKGTKYGISAMSYPHLNIRGLTLDQARKIYKRDYWDKMGLDRPEFNNSIAIDLFDMAVNSGVRNSARTLQKAVRTNPDGRIGPITLEAIALVPICTLRLRFNAERLNFMINISFWNRFSKGWVHRIIRNMKR